MIINLISGPRNISTALMYAFAQRNDTTVVDEPFYAAYLLRTGVQHPGRDEVIASQENDAEEVWAALKVKNEESRILFIKNMAHHLEALPQEWLEEMTNVFLIREPKDVITSFAKVIPEPELRDIGLGVQTAILKRLKGKGRPILVLDTKELLKDPGAVLSELCKGLGIEFQENMLHWEQGARPEDGVWSRYWYGNVHRTSGFGPYREKTKKLPKHLETLFEESLLHYNELKQYAIGS